MGVGVKERSSIYKLKGKESVATDGRQQRGGEVEGRGPDSRGVA